jgi:hypothetical protein
VTTPPPLPYGPAAPPAASPRGFNSGKGRVAGVPNAVTKTLKEAILLAAEEAGNAMAAAAAENGEERTGGLAGYLLAVATSDAKTFCGLLGKVLPMQITGNDGKALEVVFRTVYEEAVPKGATSTP